MEEEGVVIEKRGGSVLVKFEPVSCDGCAHFQICNPSGGKKIIELPNTVGAAVGDRLRVEIENRVFTLAAVMVFGLPVACLVAGYLLARKIGGSEQAAALSGMGGAAFSFVLLALFDKNVFGRKTRLHASITGIKGGASARGETEPRL